MAQVKLDPTLNSDMGQQIAQIDTMLTELYTTAIGEGYQPGGTDVAIADGGTGQSTAAAGFRALAEGISSTQGAVLYRNATQWVALSPGTNGQVLTSAGASANPSWTTLSAGSGDVTAAASFATDNVIIRADGTGKGVQGSNITITDAGALVINQTAAPTYIFEHTFDNAAEPIPGIVLRDTVTDADDITTALTQEGGYTYLHTNYTGSTGGIGYFGITTGDYDDRLVITTKGNIHVGGTAATGVGAITEPTSAEGALVILNGTAPTGNATNGVILYAEDVSSSSELKVRDEAGNVTTLSPHNFSLIPDGPSEDLAWAYYSEQNGKRINVDMLKLARMVEQLTGEKLVYTA